MEDFKNPSIEGEKEVKEQISHFSNSKAEKSKKKHIEKVVYTAAELMALGNTEPKYLAKPIFPQTGTAVLSGKPDIGKSQLARQFCINVSTGEKEFLGYDLNLVHKRAIYVTTEDGQDATTYLINKQFAGMGKDGVDSLRFILADTMSQKKILSKLDSELKKSPADLVVVDSFGDIFEGDDSNKNTAMRKTVKLFDKVAKKHNCLILFVHHVNKASYKQSPGQEQIQGGSGLVQKVRLAVILFEGVGSKRYFSVVKGNYCPKEFKEKSSELDFSEQTFLFKNTGNMVLTSELGNPSGYQVRKEKKIHDDEKIALEILGDKTMSACDFLQEYERISSKSETTGKRVLKSLSDKGFIDKTDKGYKIALKLDKSEED